FLYANGTMTNVGTGYGGASFAFGINASGVAVGGTSWPGTVNGAALLFNAGSVTDLNTVLDGSGAGWRLWQAAAINDAGWIVGYVHPPVFPSTIQHAFLLTPINPLTGDYNFNGVVDAADYIVWRKSVGQTGPGLAADGNLNNQIDSGDYDIWRAHFGQSFSFN